MKTLQIFANSLLATLWLSGSAIASELPMNVDETIAGVVKHSAVGQPTNKFQGKAVIAWPSNDQSEAEIAIFLESANAGNTNTQANPANGVPPATGVASNASDVFVSMANTYMSDVSICFLSTNNFCGPIELHDPEGHVIPCLKPAASNSSSYPSSFSIGEARANYERSHPIQLGPPFQYPTRITRLPGELARFKLTDYFRLMASGEYTFVVWPAIYERTATNSDTCKRLDLPPVSIAFHWESTTGK